MSCPRSLQQRALVIALLAIGVDQTACSSSNPSGGGGGGQSGASGDAGFDGAAGARGRDGGPEAGDAGGDAGPICGGSQCGPHQVCVSMSCGGGAAVCTPAPDGGQCPSGLTYSATCAAGRPGCMDPPCSPPPPSCMDVPAACAAPPTCSCLSFTVCGAMPCASVVNGQVFCAFD